MRYKCDINLFRFDSYTRPRKKNDDAARKRRELPALLQRWQQLYTHKKSFSGCKNKARKTLYGRASSNDLENLSSPASLTTNVL